VRATVFGDRFFQRVLAGLPAQVLGDPGMPHSYSYGPDVARGMIRLGEAGDDVLGQVWHLPVCPAESTRALMDRFAPALGVAVHLQRVSDWILRGLGLFQPVLSEVAEMTYQWKKPFVLDDSKWRRRFGDESTPVEHAVAFTARWALDAFGRARAA
jgi:nucleoside-diphosphate-sugar epimerase